MLLVGRELTNNYHMSNVFLVGRGAQDFEGLARCDSTDSRDVGQWQAHLLWEQDIGGSSPLIPTLTWLAGCWVVGPGPR